MTQQEHEELSKIVGDIKFLISVNKSMEYITAIHCDDINNENIDIMSMMLQAVHNSEKIYKKLEEIDIYLRHNLNS